MAGAGAARADKACSVGPLDPSWSCADIVVIGETHDNPDHHTFQAFVLNSAAPVAVVFEMLSPEQVRAAAGIDRLNNTSALGDAFGWEAAGWPDFAIYAPVFAAAPYATLVGAAIPPAQISAAVETGAADVFGPDAAAYGLSPLDPADQLAREAEQAAAHCGALPPEMLAGMVEVQRLRDAHFARVTLQALDTFGGLVVLITGTGHARNDIGVPAAIRRARPEVQVWAIGQFETTQNDAPFDTTNITPPMVRPDPCLAFQ